MRERETTRCLRANLLFWLGFLEYRNTMFGSVNQSSDEDPKPKLIVRIGFCTPQYCVLSIACTRFKIDETFYPEYPSGLIWIQTVFANGERETGAGTSK